MIIIKDTETNQCPFRLSIKWLNRAEFLKFSKTIRKAGEIPLVGEMSRSDKRVCRITDLLLPKTF